MNVDSPQSRLSHAFQYILTDSRQEELAVRGPRMDRIEDSVNEIEVSYLDSSNKWLPAVGTNGQVDGYV